MNSIFHRVFRRHLLLIIFLSTVIFLFNYKLIRSTYLNTLSSDLQRLAIAMHENILQKTLEGDLQKLDDFAKSYGHLLDARITVIDTSGVVLADSRNNPAEMENHKDRPEVLEALQGETGQSLRFSSTVKEKMLYVAMPLNRDREKIGILRLSLFLRDIQSLINSMLKQAFAVSTFFILVASVIAAFFSKQLSQPISDLAAASQRVASGEFDVEVPPQKWAEIRILSNNFNEMVRQIRMLFAEITRQKEELTTVIGSIQEALVVIKPKGTILLCNESFRNLSNSNKRLKGEKIFDIINSTELQQQIDCIRQEKTPFQQELLWQNQNYMVSYSYLKTKRSKEIVIIFHNISQIRNLERIKKDFIANVSHELRTPLTSIKGFVETLLEDSDDEQSRQLRIIERNTNRMISMVEDLLTLAELEESSAIIRPEAIDLGELITELLPIFREKTKKKGLAIELDFSPNLPKIEGDSYRLEQLFVNLIDNAIKYTESGKLSISTNADSINYHIRIADTGIGIPEKYKDRIFERFYVIDKSRSRRVGGTGLGLSIVKHIVLLHGGNIIVESERNLGTTFHISLPLIQRKSNNPLNKSHLPLLDLSESASES